MRCATSSSPFSAACTSGSRLSPEAVARCSISTTARIAALRSAGSGSRRWGAIRASASRPATRPRASRAGARRRSSSRRDEEGGGRPRVADLPERVEGRVLQPRLAAQGLDEAGNGLRRADLPEARRGGVAHVHVGVGQGVHERLDRGLLPHRAEHDRGEEPDLLVRVAQQGEQRRPGGGAAAGRRSPWPRCATPRRRRRAGPPRARGGGPRAGSRRAPRPRPAAPPSSRRPPRRAAARWPRGGRRRRGRPPPAAGRAPPRGEGCPWRHRRLIIRSRLRGRRGAHSARSPLRSPRQPAKLDRRGSAGSAARSSLGNDPSSRDRRLDPGATEP